MKQTFDTAGALDYQHDAALNIFESLTTHGVSFDASDMGTGKTYTAGCVLKNMMAQLQSRAFIVCPRVVIPSWQTACNHYGITPLGILNYEKLTRGNTLFVQWIDDPKSKTLGHFEWSLPLGTVIVFDEVHKCKGEDSLNGLLLRAAKDQGYLIHTMSATAATTPTEMFSLGYILGLHQGGYREFKQWCIDHGCEWTGAFGAQTFNYGDEKAMKAMKGLHDHIFTETRKGTRISINDLGDKFPETKITADAVDMGVNTPKIQRIYEVMEREIALLEEKSENYSAHVFAVMMKARRLCELQKVPTFVEMIKDLVSQGKSVAVFVSFTDTVNAIRVRLSKKMNVSYIIGGQGEQDREVDIELFQMGVNKVMLANISAGGVGVSLHDTTGENERHSLISPNYSAIQVSQSMGRVRRQGGGYSRQQVLFAANTIEEEACNRVRGKLGNINLLNDGDLTQGINF
jgi:hypothetical protein